jgi:flagellin-like hook-associated protein FlgL
MIEFENLKKLVADAEADVMKLDSGNKAAGTRVRKAMQDIKQACQAIREKVLQSRSDSDAPQSPQAPAAQ